ncbi:MAG TPA: VOC family protein [Candidatus Limnocylindrales bacterium]|nr:VOC family protein [Candidatus Limnocylindrales bacterium]
MSLRQTEVVIDCADHDIVVGFWVEALGGWQRREVDEQFVALVPPADGPSGDGPAPLPLLFQKVPEAKVGKNRVHLDFRSDDRLTEVARLVALGASIRAEHCIGDFCWTVMADPEGNEFCVS